MRFKRFKFGAIGLLAAVTFACAPAALLAQGHEPWENPPSEYREIGRQGFHDGVEGARKDFENHRRPDVNNRDEYRHPNVPGPQRQEYQDAFRRGYQAGVDHLMGGRR